MDLFRRTLRATSRKDKIAEAKDEIDYFRMVARLPDDTAALSVAKRCEEETLGYIKYILSKTPSANHRRPLPFWKRLCGEMSSESAATPVDCAFP